MEKTRKNEKNMNENVGAAGSASISFHIRSTQEYTNSLYKQEGRNTAIHILQHFKLCNIAHKRAPQSLSPNSAFVQYVGPQSFLLLSM